VTTKFTVPYTAYSGAFTALWVAADENFFAKQGFDVSVQYMDANVAASALLSGEIPFSSTPAIVNTILSGGDAAIVAKLVSYPNFSLYATKDIQRVEDVKGKVLADTQRGTAPDNAVRDVAQPVAVDFDHAPAGQPQTGIEADQSHRPLQAANFARASSDTSKLA